MKCLCGYDTNDEECQQWSGDKEFIRVGNRMIINGGLYERDYTASFYACPKCGTVRLEKEVWV